MAVYNTKLINQYTRTHHLVRPYLMIIRFWAKIQVGILVIIALLRRLITFLNAFGSPEKVVLTSVSTKCSDCLCRHYLE